MKKQKLIPEAEPTQSKIQTELDQKLEELLEITKDYGKFLHLFSEDVGVKTMAELRKVAMEIQFHLRLQKIKEIAHPENKPLKKPVFGKMGCLVAIRPCGEKFGKKTYLGFLLGEMALGSSVTITDDKIQCNWAQHNPAIFIPEFGEIVYGCESWWSEIETEADLNQISDNDIANVWYVKAIMKKVKKAKVKKATGNSKTNRI